MESSVFCVPGVHPSALCLVMWIETEQSSCTHALFVHGTGRTQASRRYDLQDLQTWIPSPEVCRYGSALIGWGALQAAQPRGNARLGGAAGSRGAHASQL